MDILEQWEKPNFVSGSIKLKAPVRFYWHDLNDTIHLVQFPELDSQQRADKLHKLFDRCQPAGYGNGMMFRMDDQVRKARSLTRDLYCSDLPMGDMLPAIEKFMNCRVAVIPYKLNAYGPGGHFATHQDTPRSYEDLGSLVVCLPSDFEGGDLSVHNNLMGWGKKSEPDVLRWCAFYGDTPHKVETVLAGLRLTLCYNIQRVVDNGLSSSRIHTETSPILETSTILETSPIPCEDLARLEDWVCFRWGRKYPAGFGCLHMYSCPEAHRDPSTLLRGLDLKLWQGLSMLGMAPVLQRVIIHQEDLGMDLENVTCDCCKTTIFLEQDREWFRDPDYDFDMCIPCMHSKKGQRFLAKKMLKSPQLRPFFHDSKGRQFISECFEDMTIHVVTDPSIPTSVLFKRSNGGRKFEDKFPVKLDKIHWLRSAVQGEHKKAGSGDFLYGNDPSSIEKYYWHYVMVAYPSKRLCLSQWVARTLMEQKKKLNKELWGLVMEHIYVK